MARNGSRGRCAAWILRELEVHLEEQWNWAPGRALFELDVAAVVRKQLRVALVWGDQLKEDSGDDAQTRFCKKLRRFEDFVRNEHFSPSELIILKAMLHRFDDSCDAPDEPPPLLQYLAAWIFALGMIGYFLWYLLEAGDRMGRKTSAAWLATVTLGLVFNYVAILPSTTAIFYIMVPGTIHKTVRRCIDPSIIKNFPFAAQCPSSASYYILQRHPELLDTPIAEFVLDDPVEAHVAVDQIDRELEDIWSDTLSCTSPSFLMRIVLQALAVFVVLDEDVQDVLIAEFMAFLPLVAQFGKIELSAGSAGRAQRGNVGSLVVFAVSLLVIAYFSHFAHSKPARAKVYS